MTTLDFARFRLDDPDAVVASTFACPACLHAPCRVVLANGEEFADARVTCATCDYRWRVALDPRQLLRLALDPPSELVLDWDEHGRGFRTLRALDLGLPDAEDC